MKKLLFVIALFIMAVPLIGCGQKGLSEEEIRSIVREEVTRQLAGTQLKGIVGKEVTGQLTSIDKLTISELYIKNKDGKIVAEFCGGATDGYLNFLNPDGNGVVFISESGLTITDDEQYAIAIFGTIKSETGAVSGQLMLFNSDGERVSALRSTEDGNGVLSLQNSEGEYVTILGGKADGNGYLNLFNSRGELIAILDSDVNGQSMLQLWNRYGEVTASIGSPNDDGLLVIHDKYGNVSFVAP